MALLCHEPQVEPSTPSADDALTLLSQNSLASYFTFIASKLSTNGRTMINLCCIVTYADGETEESNPETLYVSDYYELKRTGLKGLTDLYSCTYIMSFTVLKLYIYIYIFNLLIYFTDFGILLSPHLNHFNFLSNVRLLLTWSHSDDCFENCTFMYEVTWQQSGDGSSLRNITTTETSYTIEDLTPGTSYEIGVGVYCKKDPNIRSVEGNSFSFKTYNSDFGIFKIISRQSICIPGHII